ncbi:MAG: hypothetical protein K8F91_19905 [Candidatus Obscuribacterales bacterium]|nr:hypothetical protein [Candidatus Obscuribacterales bacterium]
MVSCKKPGFIVLISIILLGLGLFVSETRAAGKKVFKTTDETLTTVTFDTYGGLVRCNLPADMRAGDTISGTIQLEPDGSNASYKEKNLKKLNDYIVFVGEYEAYVRLGEFRFRIPDNKTSLEVSLVVRKNSRFAAETVSVALASQDKPKSGYAMSNFVEANKPVKITGDFPGDFRVAAVDVNGQTVPQLAQSPRSLVFLPPDNMSGSLKVSLNEGSSKFSGELTALSISISMVTNKIERGKSHSILVRVVGLKDDAPSVMVKVENLTPQIVNLEGGDVQSVGAKSDTGTWELKREVLGARWGTFRIVASLVPSSKQVKLVMGAQ